MFYSCLVIMYACVSVFLTRIMPDKVDYIIGVILIFFSVSGIYTLLIFINKKIDINDNIFVYNNIINKKYHFNLDEIKNVELADYGRYINSQIIIDTESHKRLKIPYHCQGYEDIKNYFHDKGML
ncbi:hypothetical protein SAMN02910411_1541 [Pseudobutyrivibrio ruminis DSM 9787]|uniref:PH domain-containing protein n=1 Tax=Pseudobutyrivibrio ruminis DSM 9787 TaxID=1123011 RepID=A0A285RWL3_9FIRM|nr:hypothetical protein SAMN02910411_1541 [Pseudobutyrivibrio ruminis DSM 9787]